MPSNYVFNCPYCGWRGERYRNLRYCPTCKGQVEREPPTVIKIELHQMLEPEHAILNLTMNGEVLLDCTVTYHGKQSAIGIALVLAADRLRIKEDESK